MSFCLGIDTSNYTTSAALYNNNTGQMAQMKKLLTVQTGKKGLRQSDAVFQHIKSLPVVLHELTADKESEISVVGVSAKPRSVADSYMPCFEAGLCVAHSIQALLKIPCYEFSHQEGHIAAALFSIGRLDLLKQPFLAFHVSGGTTEAVKCFPGNIGNFTTQIIASSLDLKAGQAIDRVGQMLGLGFPAGPELEKLALQSNKKFKIRPCLKEGNCCLSGLENQCGDMIRSDMPFPDIARYCLLYIQSSLDAMIDFIYQKEDRRHPLIFAGGVMSNTILREYFERKYGALFAAPGYSSDNAAGIAILAKLRLNFDEK